MKKIFPFALALFFLTVFNSGEAIAAKNKAEKKPKLFDVYKFDLDGDGKAEIIRVDNNKNPSANTRVVVLRRNRTEIGSFTVAGAFNKITLVDLNEDGHKQLAVFCSASDNFTNLAVYGFKNNKPLKVFAAGSSLGIEADFRSVLARIKVGRVKKIEKGYAYTDIPEWDTWVWSGDKFILER